MNNIIYIVGLVVIVLADLGLFRAALIAVARPGERGCGALPLPGRALGFPSSTMERFADITEPAIAALVARFYAKARAIR